MAHARSCSSNGEFRFNANPNPQVVDFLQHPKFLKDGQGFGRPLFIVLKLKLAPPRLNGSQVSLEKDDVAQMSLAVPRSGRDRIPVPP